MAEFLLYLSVLWAGAALGLLAAAIVVQAGED